MSLHDHIGVTAVATEEEATTERKGVARAATHEDVQGTSVTANVAIASDMDERTITLTTSTETTRTRRTDPRVRRGAAAAAAVAVAIAAAAAVAVANAAGAGAEAGAPDIVRRESRSVRTRCTWWKKPANATRRNARRKSPLSVVSANNRKASK